MASIFTRIINRELPARIFYETDEVIVIQDHRPRAATHLLIIPKAESQYFYQTEQETLSLLDETVKIVAEKLGLENHFQVLINNGFRQEVDHLHYHFMSDRLSEKLTFLNE
ncbi:MAG: HIT family protein [bacterium]|nr:HIT family protein [bacterium]